MTVSTVPTLKAARACHPLAPAVLRQLGGGREAIQSAIDAANHGADGGFHGFCYYTDTEAFAKRNRRKIAEAIHELGRDLGEEDIQVVRGFNCLRSDEPHASVVACALWGGSCASNRADELLTVRNALAWFALEEVGHTIVRLTKD